MGDQIATKNDARLSSGPFNEFNNDVLTADGQIDLLQLASVLKLPVSAVSLNTFANSVTPISDAELQLNGALLLGMANSLAAALGSRLDVLNYLQTPQPALSGRTPADELEAGHLKFLCGRIEELLTLRPD